MKNNVFRTNLPFLPSCQEKEVLTRVNQEKIGSKKVCSKTNVTVTFS